MKLTSLTVRHVEGMTRLKGYARISLDNQLVINEIKIIQAEHGMCIEFPKEKDLKKTKFETIALLDSNIRNHIQSLVLEAFEIDADYFLVTHIKKPSYKGRFSYTVLPYLRNRILQRVG